MADEDPQKEIPLEVFQSGAFRARCRKSNIIHEANNFAQRVSLIGLTHATDRRSSNSRRVIWIFWLAFGFGLAVYQIQDRIVYYYSFPYSTEFQIRTAKELRFPQVTICKEEWMSKTKANEFEISEIIQTLMQMFENALTRDDFNFTEYDEHRKQLLVRLHNSTQDWETLSKNVSHKWENLVQYLSWNGNSNKSMVKEILTDLGHCFAIGTNSKPLISTEPGIRAGLEIYLNAMQSDSVFLPTPDHEIFSGFRLLIHDPDEEPRMLEAGFVISPGSVAQVAVTFQNVTQLGPPYSDCHTDPYYRVVNCLADCEDEFFLNECNCRPFYYIRPDEHAFKKHVCSLVDHFKCLNKFKHNRHTSKNYHCNCSQQCHGRIYDYSLSQSKISNKLLRFYDAIAKAKRKNESSADEGNTDHDLTAVYIYFPNLMYKDITSVEAYSFLALLCDVGGALSLLLGATLLTVYEVAEFLALVARDFLRSRFRY